MTRVDTKAPRPVSRHELEDFVLTFSDLLEGDGRHHFWIGAVDNSGLLVYDNHNVIYAYGPLEKFQEILLESAFSSAGAVTFPDPHIHRYNAPLDQRVDELMSYWPWKKFPLQEND